MNRYEILINELENEIEEILDYSRPNHAKEYRNRTRYIAIDELKNILNGKSLIDVFEHMIMFANIGNDTQNYQGAIDLILPILNEQEKTEIKEIMEEYFTE